VVQKHAGVAAAAMACCAAAFGQPLRDLADQRAIRVGAAVDPSHFSETSSGTLAREFNQAESENAMKFGQIHPGPTTYSFSQADAIVSFARAHNIAVRGHTLVWYSQNPDWLINGGYTAAPTFADPAGPHRYRSGPLRRPGLRVARGE